MNKLTNCPDCAVKPGQAHHDGCDVERCSSCGGQRLQCDCKNHDRKFSRWTGIWPGVAEAEYLGMVTTVSAFDDRKITDLNQLYIDGIYKKLFIKPKK